MSKEINISNDKTKVRDIFGLLKGKLKRSTQEILDEIDEEERIAEERKFKQLSRNKNKEC